VIFFEGHFLDFANELPKAMRERNQIHTVGIAL